MAEADSHKRAFCIPFGNYGWSRMPSGLVNATATFQQLMEATLFHCQDFCCQYVVEIYARRFWKKHQPLASRLWSFTQHRLIVKFSKTVSATSSLLALDGMVSEAGIAPAPEKARAIANQFSEDLHVPTDVTSIKYFLGMVGLQIPYTRLWRHQSSPSELRSFLIGIFWQ